jgi:hypothetical protein
MRAAFLLIVLTTLSSFHFPTINKNDLIGAWQLESGSTLSTKIYSAKYFSVAIYNPKEKTFQGTAGGEWSINNGQIVEKFEFHTLDPEKVGTEVRTPFKQVGKTLEFNSVQKETWKLVDNGTPGELAGAWLITGRMNNGEISRRTPGVRKTMKILSGTHFQWIAYNTETKEFSGTGGGTYTTKDGKYTENIEFFSRDNSRVGASLQFDFTLENGEWHHKGLSSKGDPIHEIWTRRENLESEIK